ncbi:MAG: hypothetical protein O2866_01075 [archaeon]|nr:hypothetical protein [archaeon]
MNSSKLMRRFEELDQPTHGDDLVDIWKGFRALLSIVRVVVIFAIIIVSELFNEIIISSLSLSIWSIIVGLPLFLVISIVILLGDSLYSVDDSDIEPV